MYLQLCVGISKVCIYQAITTPRDNLYSKALKYALNKLSDLKPLLEEPEAKVSCETSEFMNAVESLIRIWLLQYPGYLHSGNN